MKKKSRGGRLWYRLNRQKKVTPRIIPKFRRVFFFLRHRAARSRSDASRLMVVHHASSVELFFGQEGGMRSRWGAGSG